MQRGEQASPPCPPITKVKKMEDIDNIEYKIANHEITSEEVFTLMRQIIDSQSDRHYRAGFMAGWNAGKCNDERIKQIVEKRTLVN